VFIDDAQIEPGYDPADRTRWAIIAQHRSASRRPVQ
jgi:hypothetical protein